MLFLREHPFCECEECRGEDLTQLAEVVDHHIPHRGDQRLFWDQKNWRGLTKSHHDRKTAREDRLGLAPLVRGCDADGNPLGAEHGWNR